MASPRTEQIYPAIFMPGHTEFRLNMAPGYRNLRLANLGAVAIGAPALYTDAAGVYSLLSRVALYDGGTLLDEVVDVYAWMAFQSLRRAGPGRDSGLDYSLFTPLTGSSRSYGLTPDGQSIAHISTRNGGVATTDSATTAKGWLAIDALLSFVQRAGTLDTRAFTALRLVVEFRTDPTVLFAGANAAITGVSILVPVLLAERMDADALAASPAASVVGYNRILTERVSITGGVVGAPPNMTPQTAAVRLLAPLGRVINRMVCAPVRADAASNAEAIVDSLKDGSAEVYDGEVWQFSVNGENLLPYAGADTWARKTHLLWQAWGDLHVPQGGAYQGWTNAAPAVNSLAGLYEASQILDAAGGAAGVASHGPLVGQQGYAGFVIGRRVSDLQLRYSRQLTTRRAGGATMRFFYECPAVVSGISHKAPAGYTVAFA